MTAADVLISTFALLVWQRSWTAAFVFALAILYSLGCQLIAYRQSEDVAALAKRLDGLEADAKKALRLAESMPRPKAPGY